MGAASDDEPNEGSGGAITPAVATTGAAPSHSQSLVANTNTTKPSPTTTNDTQQNETVENEVQTSYLHRLKKIFEESDTDGDPGLNPEEFRDAMRSLLGLQLTEKELELMFMRVDANCDGNVEWKEFLEYTLREYEEKDEMTKLLQEKYFPYDGHVIEGTRHRDEIRKICFIPTYNVFNIASIDYGAGKCMTCTMDGLVDVYGLDFGHTRSTQLQYETRERNKNVRVLDIVCMPNAHLFVVLTTSGEVRFHNYDAAKFDLYCIVYGFKSNPLCAYYHFEERASYLILGDQGGGVTVFTLGAFGAGGPFEGFVGSDYKRILIATLVRAKKVRYFADIHHGDWINQVHYSKTLASFISCSNNSEISMYVGAVEQKQTNFSYQVRYGGVNCVDVNEAHNVIVTGGADRVVRVWNPYMQNRASTIFAGHEYPIDQVVVAVDRKMNLVVIFSVDRSNTLRVWDMKGQTSIQVIEVGRSLAIMSGIPTAWIFFNQKTLTLLLAQSQLIVYEREVRRKGLRAREEITTHSAPITSAVFNIQFDCIVSACENSQITVWNMETGEKMMQFQNAHTQILNEEVTPSPITCMAFDGPRRRLITGGLDGMAKIWNFNNGAMLRELDYMDGKAVTCLRYHRPHETIIFGGWSKFVVCVVDTRGDDDGLEILFVWDVIHLDDIVCLDILYPQTEIEAIDEEMKQFEIRDRERKETEARRQERMALGKHPDILSENSENGSDDDDNDAISSLGSWKSSRSGSNAENIQRFLGGSKSTESANEETPQSVTAGAEKRASSFTTTSNGQACSTIATGSYDGDIVLWTMETGKPSFHIHHRVSDQLVPATHFDQERDKIAVITDRGGGIKRIRYVNPNYLQQAQDATSTADGEKREVRFGDAKVVNNENDDDDDDKTVIDRTHGRDAVQCCLFLLKRPTAPSVAKFLVATQDGLIRFWSVHRDGKLLPLWRSVLRLKHFITSMSTDLTNDVLFAGDSEGYVKIWLMRHFMDGDSDTPKITPLELKRDFPAAQFPGLNKYFLALNTRVRELQKLGPFEAQLSAHDRALFQPPILLNHFRAHTRAVTAIEYLETRHLLMTGSKDFRVRLWNLNGTFIGTFGQEQMWHLHEPYNFERNECPGGPHHVPTDLQQVASMCTLDVLKEGERPAGWKRARTLMKFTIAQQLKVKRKFEQKHERLSSQSGSALEERLEEYRRIRDGGENALDAHYERLPYLSERLVRKKVQPNKFYGTETSVWSTLPIARLSGPLNVDETMATGFQPDLVELMRARRQARVFQQLLAEKQKEFLQRQATGNVRRNVDFELKLLNSQAANTGKAKAAAAMAESAAGKEADAISITPTTLKELEQKPHPLPVIAPADTTKLVSLLKRQKVRVAAAIRESANSGAGGQTTKDVTFSTATEVHGNVRPATSGGRSGGGDRTQSTTSCTQTTSTTTQGGVPHTATTTTVRNTISSQQHVVAQNTIISSNTIVVSKKIGGVSIPASVPECDSMTSGLLGDAPRELNSLWNVMQLGGPNSKEKADAEDAAMASALAALNRPPSQSAIKAAQKRKLFAYFPMLPRKLPPAMFSFRPKKTSRLSASDNIASTRTNGRFEADFQQDVKNFLERTGMAEELNEDAERERRKLDQMLIDEEELYKDNEMLQLQELVRDVARKKAQAHEHHQTSDGFSVQGGDVGGGDGRQPSITQSAVTKN